MSNEEPTVFIIDDDEAVRDSLMLLLQSVGLNAKAFDGGRAFLEQYDMEATGCAVLDIRMPGMSGMELQDKLNEMHSILPIIFITGHGDVPMAVKAVQSGALDFIQKPFRDQDLIDRINDALRLDLEHRVELTNIHDIEKRFGGLTKREQEVIMLVTDGCANKVIAIDLSLSQRTVELHRAHAMQKMQAKSLAQLIRMMVSIKRA